MQSLVSLNGFYSPEISEYLLSHKWPSLMEVSLHNKQKLRCMYAASPSNTSQALISGVCVMLPEDPWDFMHSSVMSIKENDMTDIQWCILPIYTSTYSINKQLILYIYIGILLLTLQ